MELARSKWHDYNCLHGVLESQPKQTHRSGIKLWMDET